MEGGEGPGADDGTEQAVQTADGARQPVRPPLQDQQRRDDRPVRPVQTEHNAHHAAGQGGEEHLRRRQRRMAVAVHRMVQPVACRGTVVRDPSRMRPAPMSAHAPTSTGLSPRRAIIVEPPATMTMKKEPGDGSRRAFCRKAPMVDAVVVNSAARSKPPVPS